VSVPRSARLPAGVDRTTLPAAHGELAAIVAEPSAPASAGGPTDVLCVPGYTGSKEDFAPVLPLLAAAGLRTWAIDLRGQYHSRGDDSTDPAVFRRDALAGDVASLVARLGRPHLVAHSYGGIVSRAAVLAGARPASLSMLGSGPAGIQGNRLFLIEAMQPILADGGVEAVWAAAEAVNANDPRSAGAPADVQAFLAERFLASPAAALRAMGEDLRDEPDQVAALAEIARSAGIPLFVAHGQDDDAWPPEVQRDMAERLGAAYAVIPDSLHSPAVEAPEATAAALLGFWRARRD
jgi:pimeloyl-ACP methyl ester carboxylesterase